MVLAAWFRKNSGKIEVTTTVSDLGQFVDITLSAEGLAALNAALGGQIAFGGNIVTFDGVADAETLFAFTSDPDATHVWNWARWSRPQPP